MVGTEVEAVLPSGLPSPQPIDELRELDPRWLHVFIGGPGRGETVLIALPERGWLILDAAVTHLVKDMEQGNIGSSILDR